MKKVIFAALLLSGTYAATQAQTPATCLPNSTAIVAKPAADNSNDQFAQNFKVCKGRYGYRICGQTRTFLNSTMAQIPLYMENPQQPNTVNYDTRSWSSKDNDYASNSASVSAQLIAPQSQSYPEPVPVYYVSTGNENEDNFPKPGHIVVGGDNATAPYEGKSSPQYDGPAKNQQRNLKVNSPEQNSTDPSFSLPNTSGNVK